MPGLANCDTGHKALCPVSTLFIDGQLRGYNAGSLTELVIICIYEELVTQEFAPPQELPISTTRVHVI